VLHVVEAASEPTFHADRSRGTVVIESDIVGAGRWPDAIAELSDGGGARSAALNWAAQRGMGQPCLNGSVSGAYAINKMGESIDVVQQEIMAKTGLPPKPQDPRMQIARYRIDIPVAARM
jgi:hypothetical protein